MTGLPQKPSLKTAARALGRSVLNILYPPRCSGCGRPDNTPIPDSARLCSDCIEKLDPVVPPFCDRCGESFAGNMGSADAFACTNCVGQAFAFDFAIASYESTRMARDLVHRFKYQREFHLRTALGAMLMPALEDRRIQSTGDWVLIPVPLHSRRRREREFNQAAEIARFASRRSGLTVVDALKRTRYTSQQAHLDRQQRLANLRDAFVMRRDKRLGQLLEGKNLLLVDDVFTTGTTVNECARVLRAELDPPRLAVATVARG